MNEYPKEPGWYWFREGPHSMWHPVKLFSHGMSYKYLDRRDWNKDYWIDETWPQQWGPKIEEPKV